MGQPVLNLNWRVVNDAGSDVVGWPNPVTVPGTTLWPYQQMTALIPMIRAALFGAILLPPCTLGAAGAWSGGYDLLDPYTLDGTAFGTAEMLRELVAVAHANGIKVWGDLVLHQYDGGANNTYPSKRWPKTPSCFSGISGGVPADPVPDETGNFGFGVLAAYVAGRLKLTDPPGYMHDGAVANAQFLTRTIGFDGWRIDDAKGTNAQVVYDITHAEYISELDIIYEYFDGSPGPVSNYVNGYEKRRGSVMDFALKFNVGNICNNNSRSWMGQCANLGWCDIDAYTALTFVESADTDTSPGQQTIWNKPEAYAIMFAKPGVPMAYWRDYAQAPLCYGLKPSIDNLVWIWWMLSQGDTVVRLDTDPQVFACERLGTALSPGCLFVVNNDQYNEHTVTLPAHFGTNQRLHEYSGNGPYIDQWTDGNGALTVTTPPNNDGFGYLFFSLPDIQGGPSLPPIPTQQTFFNASDLRSGAVGDGDVVIGVVSCAEGSMLELALEVDQTALTPGASITLQVSQPNAQLLSLDLTSMPEGVFLITTGGRARVRQSGAHTLMLSCSNLPLVGVATALTATYQGELS